MSKMKKIGIAICVIILVILIVVYFKNSNIQTTSVNIVNTSSGSNNNVNVTNSNVKNSSDIKEIEKDEDGNAIINQDEITSKATFFIYTLNENTKIRLFAVKSSDGVIRTAFNTCQVCNPSPKAYFEQEGNNFICQNCGNSFPANKIGIEKGGCNPIPITNDEKTVEGNKIIIKKEFIEQYKDNFNTEL